MIFYRGETNASEPVSLTRMAFSILQDPHGQHLISLSQQGDRVEWDSFEPLVQKVEALRKGESIWYVGPEVAGTMSMSEVVARIAEQPRALHLLHKVSERPELDQEGFEQQEWVEWVCQ